MKRWLRRRSVRIASGVYLALWLVTALVGLPDVDRDFDEELAMGSLGFGGEENQEVPVMRIDFIDFSDPENFPSVIPGAPWRCRSNGFAIAPFVIVDEAAWQDHALSGFAGRRVVIWAFGFVRWFPIQKYWVS